MFCERRCTVMGENRLGGRPGCEPEPDGAVGCRTRWLRPEAGPTIDSLIVALSKGQLQSATVQRASAILGHRSIGFVARRLTQRSLRIVAYHDVPDADAFRSQLVAFKRHYRMVDEATVVEAAVTGRPREPRSAWITYDDGHPTVVERAQPVLDELGLPATV